MIRGSVGNGFRAPTLGELNRPVATGTTEQYIDPLYVSDGPVQSNNLNGGNRNLVPEKSIYASGGFVWTPTKNFTAAVDYWYLQIKNYITTPAALALIDVARAGKYVYSPNEVVFSVPGDVTSQVDSVDQTFQNAGTATFDGLDFRGTWRIPSDYGLWSVDLNSTYYIKANLEQQGVVERNVGTIVDTSNQVPLSIPLAGGVILRYKQVIALNWNYGEWGATLVNNYITGYHTAPYQTDGTTPNQVPYFMTWDLQGTWNPIKNLQLTLGARNLLDKNPNQFIPTANQFSYGFDPYTYDPRGRVVYGRAVLTF
jgi:iron complex outermembrane receptor protein